MDFRDVEVNASTNEQKRKSVQVGLNHFSIHLFDNKKSDESKTKTLLHPVTTVIEGGSLFAILGGSGSGKTTLLNVLADRYDKKAYQISGELLFDNVVGASRNIGYVTQSDYLLPFLTVKETIMFAAKMRLSKDECIQRIEKADGSKSKSLNGHAHVEHAYNRIVNSVILDLGLKECSNTRVGDNSQVYGHRGISGGEKRRVSIAVQIISDPQVLCADEPTSGLDSFTAITVIESLLRLSKGVHSTTVICSIHQPRADVFHMFDSVLLLSKGGHPVYCGPTSAIFSYFDSLHFACPVDSNPADYFVDISAIDPRSIESEKVSRRRVLYLIKAYLLHEKQQQQQTSRHREPALIEEAAKSHTDVSPSRGLKHTNTAHPVSSGEGGGAGGDSVAYHSSWWDQVYFLTQRFTTNNYRDSSNFLGGLLQSVCLGLLVMVIFWDLGDSLEDVESMNGLMYIVISMEPYICNIILLERYCTELKVFDRELQDNMYHPSAYFVAQLLASTPQLVIMPILYSLPIYFGCNCRSGAEHVLMFIAVHIGISFTINGMVWMCLAAHRAFAIASLLANMSFTFITLVAGFLVNNKDIPVYVAWVKDISFLHYSYTILMSNQYSNYIVPGCPYPDEGDNCAQYDGNSILESRDIGVNDFGQPWGLMLTICFIYYSVAGLLLHYLRNPLTGVVGGEIHDEGDDLEVKVDSVSGKYGSEDSSGALVQLIEDYLEGEKTVSVAHNHLSAHATGDVVNAAAASLHSAEGEGQILLLDDNVVGMSVKIRHMILSVKPSNVLAASGSSSLQDAPRGSEQGSRVSESQMGLTVAQPSSDATQTDKLILNDVSANIEPGRLVALMGGSGSGKTTLLNLIAGRVTYQNTSSRRSQKSDQSSCASVFSSTYFGSGHIYFNDVIPTSEQLRQMIGYVQQFDYHLPSLTVRETLSFHAALRLAANINYSKQQQRVDKVILTLGLKQCSNTRVGGEELKGISGGEKRRLSVGIQLLGDPSVCLLDEPTTGLDAFTARHVVETLQDIAHKGRTVIMSIHQPRYDVFALVDDVILLSRGHQIWSGTTKDMLRHFESCNYPCPALTNPADFILDISSIDFRTPEKESVSSQRLDRLIIGFEKIKNDIAASTVHAAGSSNAPAADEESVAVKSSLDNHFKDKPLHVTLPLLVHRSYLNSIRQPLVSTTRITQGLFFALILSCFYAPMGDDQNSIQDRIGNLYELTALCFIGMLSCIAIFPTERNVFYREYVDGGYSANGFFLTYFVLAAPFLIVSAVLIAVLVTYAVGLQPTTQAFLVFSYVVFCFLFVGECIGVLFCALFLHVGFAVNVMSVVISLFCILAGYISIGMPQELVYISRASPITWGSYILSNIVFLDATFTCEPDEMLPSGQCPLATGEQVLDLYNMNSKEDGHNAMTYHYWMLGLLTSVFFILAMVVFRAKSYFLSH